MVSESTSKVAKPLPVEPVTMSSKSTPSTSSPSSLSPLAEPNDGLNENPLHHNRRASKSISPEASEVAIPGAFQDQYGTSIIGTEPTAQTTMPRTREAVNQGGAPGRLTSFSLGVLNSITNSIRSQSYSVPSNWRTGNGQNQLMSNSPTIANFNNYTSTSLNVSEVTNNEVDGRPDENVIASSANENNSSNQESHIEDRPTNEGTNTSNNESNVRIAEASDNATESETPEDLNKAQSSEMDKDGFFSVRLTPIIDYSSMGSGLYFGPLIRRVKPNNQIPIGRYTEKNKSAAHAPQGSSSPIVFKSKVVSRSHALFFCNEEGQWFVKDCKSSSGTFLNHIRLSKASEELTLMPLIDGDIIQLGMDYRGGTEEVYRCVKMRCEFNKSWQRKVNQFNLEIHKKLKTLALNANENASEELSECAICLLKLEPCQALFISPCSHTWHYKCIRPLILRSYPQFYCPNCRSMCDLETDIEDFDE